jgi:D-aspartate ligase
MLIETVRSATLAAAMFDANYPSSLTMMTSLGERGVPVHVYDPGAYPAARWSPHCKQTETCPDPVQFTAFQDWLRGKLRAGEITRVMPTSDLIAYHCASLRDEFPLGVRETVHSLEEIEHALIKPRFNRRCESLGLAVPQTWYPESIEAAQALSLSLPYPVMIKPRSHLGIGMAYRGAIVNDRDAFLREFRWHPPAPGQEAVMDRYPELHWPMVQRFLPNSRLMVHSLCGFRDRSGGIVAEAGVCKTDQWPRGVGMGTSFEPVSDPVTFAAGRRVVDAFLTHGLFQIELLVDGDSRLAIDLNPRAYQMISYDVGRGNDLPWLWYRSTLGESIERQPPARTDLHWRRQPIFHLSHWTRVIGGPDRLAKWKRYWGMLRQPYVGATTRTSFWSRLACEIRMFRHPRALVRPYWRERD